MICSVPLVMSLRTVRTLTLKWRATSLTVSRAGEELDMASISSIRAFATKLADLSIELDGAIIMPPQPHRAGEPMPEPEVWRTLFEESFIGPLETLKVAIGRMKPDPAKGHRCEVVIVSGISSAQVPSHYATANVIRTAWLGEAKTLAFALGPRGIHVNTLSLGGTLSPGIGTRLPLVLRMRV